MNGTMLGAKDYIEAAACAAAVAVLLLTVWFASAFVLLAFAGIILAFILCAASDFLARIVGCHVGLL